MISKDKTYRTRDGREVRIYATDGGQAYNVHGAVHHIALGWICHTWLSNGRSNMHENCDLIEVKPRHKRTVWFNAYQDSLHGIFNSREEADEWAVHFSDVRKTRIACIKVDLDFEEGEGLTHGTYTVGSGGSHPFDNGGGFTPSVNKVIKEGL